MKPQDRHLAVLIDADNIPAKFADSIFKEIATLGEASIRRIYGDFSNGGMQGWSPAVLAQHAILPHQLFAAASKKNASDIALVIDAMDILHSGRFHGFVLVSSDSDFTRLASRIREQGLDVFGIGEAKTPIALRRAYKRFIQVENLGDGLDTNGQTNDPQKDSPSKATPLVLSAMQAVDNEAEWFSLGRLGHQLNAQSPDFDTRSYGCPNLSTLLKKAGAFEVKTRDKILEVRRKPAKAKPHTAP